MVPRWCILCALWWSPFFSSSATGRLTFIVFNKMPFEWSAMIFGTDIWLLHRMNLSTFHLVPSSGKMFNWSNTLYRFTIKYLQNWWHSHQPRLYFVSCVDSKCPNRDNMLNWACWRQHSASQSRQCVCRLSMCGPFIHIRWIYTIFTMATCTWYHFFTVTTTQGFF